MYDIKLMTTEETLRDSTRIMDTLDKALEHCVLPGWTSTDVLSHVISDPTNFHIWSVTDFSGQPVAYFATRTIAYPKHMALNVLALANVYGKQGILEHYSYLMDDFEKIIIEHGFRKLEMVGRKGWDKVLKPYGYEMDYITYSKDLGDKDD